MLRMREEIIDIETALRRRLNWGKGVSLGGESTSSRELIEEVDSHIKSLKNKINYRDKLIAHKQEVISDREATINENIQQIKELKEEIDRLKSVVGSSPRPRMTSRNSSIPPSKNPIGIKQTRSLRERSGKAVGGQVGHHGTTREWNNSPDTIEQCQAPTICPSCGQDIGIIKSYEGERRQMIDIPAVVVPMVKEYVEMRRRCTCGNCAKGEFPREVSGTVCYGPQIDATVAYLSTLQNVPFGRLTHLMESLFGVKMSGATVSNILKRMRKRAQMPYEKIGHIVESSKVVGADESGVNINGKNHWMWTFQTDLASYLAVDSSRGKKVIDAHFPDGFSQATLVSDRLGLYFNVESEDHQICLAHLLRNTLYMEDYLKGNRWPIRMLKLLREAIHYRKSEGCNDAIKEDFKRQLNELLDQDVSQRSSAKQDVFDKFRRGISKHREHIFTFLSSPDIPYDNNASERSLRVVKTKLKVSGQFKTTEGAAQYATLQSIIQTARKRGLDPLVALQAVARYIGAE